MKAWTDYPFRELGDTPNQAAPVREIDVISYDGDKYCLVSVQGHKTEIKSGYIYRRQGRLGEVPGLTNAQLERLRATQKGTA